MNVNPVDHKHLLFVDDDSDESYLFNEALEQAGSTFRLSKAKDGNDLIDFLAKNGLPDIILIDLNMPYKDGLEALAELRTNPAYDQLPLVIYSTTDNPVYIDKCYKSGASMFIVKPETFDGMVEVVKKLSSIDWSNFTQPSREEFVISF